MATAGTSGHAPEPMWVLSAVRARYHPSEAHALAERSVGREADVVETARRHAVVQLVDPVLRALPAGSVPATLSAAIEGEARRVRYESLSLTAELLRALDVFQDAGIPVLPYKGPVLAQVAYGDIGLRSFLDLDVLMDRGNVGAAVDALVRAGYDPGPALSPRQMTALLRTGHDWALTNDRVAIEVQWAIANRAHARPRGVARLLDRAGAVDLGGRSVPTLDPTDQVVVLAIHGGIHLWTRLAWVVDLAQALMVPGVDPQRALGIATGAGARRMLLLGVALVDRLLGLQSAPDLVTLTERDIWALVDDLAAPLMAAGGPDLGASSGRVHRRTRLADTRRDAIKGAWRALVTPTPADWAAVALPDPLWLLYYPVRLGRMVAFAAGRGRGEGVEVFDRH